MNCPKCGKEMSWVLTEVAPDTPFWLCFADWEYIEDTESGLTLGTEIDFTDDLPIDEHINARCILNAVEARQQYRSLHDWHAQLDNAKWRN